MDYEKAYKDALERAREWYNKGNALIYADRGMCEIFPELKESEDERIRKAIIKILKGETTYTSNENTEEYVNWLEKQGEQKSTISDILKVVFAKSKQDYSSHEKKEASNYSESILPTSVTYGESKEEYMLHTIMEAAFIAGQKTNKYM